MFRYALPATLAATAIVSLAIGFGASSLVSANAAQDKPIINPTAWQEVAPQPQAHSVSLAAKPAAATCSPWDVSEVAMEEVIDEMIARGWRPPNQGDAVAAMGVSSIAATEPYAPMPYRSNWQPLDPNATVAEDVGTTPAPNDPAGGAPQPATVEQPAVPPPADS